MMKFARLALAVSLLAPFACKGKDAPESAPAAPAEMPPAHAKAAAAADGEAADHADHADHFEHRFEKAADWQKQFDDPERDEWQKPARVVELLEVKPGMVVADIGAGTGYFLSYFSRGVGVKGTVLALDIEPDMVQHMVERAAGEKLANVTVRVVDPADPKLEANSVDRIVIVNTWHHIGERVAYAAKLRSALKPGGTIAVIDYTKEAPRGPPAKHRLSPAEVIGELEKAGLAATILTEDLPLQYVVVARAAAPSAETVPFRNARSFEGVLIGGQPTVEEIRIAAHAGVTTIINLQTAKEPGAAAEEKLAGELGLRYVSIPIGGAADLTRESAKRLDEALAAAKGPALLHCASGNRVGALLAIRAFEIDKKPAAEALEIGKDGGLTGLEDAVRERLGLAAK